MIWQVSLSRTGRAALNQIKHQQKKARRAASAFHVERRGFPRASSIAAGAERDWRDGYKLNQTAGDWYNLFTTADTETRRGVQKTENPNHGFFCVLVSAVVFPMFQSCSFQFSPNRAYQRRRLRGESCRQGRAHTGLKRASPERARCRAA